MKFKLKQLNLTAGRPVVFIHEKTAMDLNIHADDRLEIAHNGKKMVAVADVIKKILSKDEVSLSDEISKYLNVASGDFVDLHITTEPESVRFIAKKVNGSQLNKEEVHRIIQDIVSNTLSEAEIAYFVSGVHDHGMSFKEMLYLTEAMCKTGRTLKWNKKPIFDKHCIGGIPGNRTTPIVVSICAAAGLTMPKTSSRAITSAAGTADVIETISNVDFSADQLQQIVKKAGGCLAWGGSLGLAPSDDKLIRVEKLLKIDPEAQLIASIMAKKLSVGSTHVLIDIPCGEGAKVSLKEAKSLGKKFVKVGNHFKIKVFPIYTDGSQPIGNGIGPILEMADVIRVLRRENPPKDLEKKSLELAGRILEISGKAKKNQGVSLAKEILESKKALEKFEQIIHLQGLRHEENSKNLFKKIILSEKSGKIISINNRLINNLARILGCPVDKLAGLILLKHKNEKISKGEPILELYSESQEKLNEGMLFHNNNPPIVVK